MPVDLYGQGRRIAWILAFVAPGRFHRISKRYEVFSLFLFGRLVRPCVVGASFCAHRGLDQVPAVIAARVIIEQMKIVITRPLSQSPYIDVRNCWTGAVPESIFWRVHFWRSR